MKWEPTAEETAKEQGKENGYKEIELHARKIANKILERLPIQENEDMENKEKKEAKKAHEQLNGVLSYCHKPDKNKNDYTKLSEILSLDDNPNLDKTVIKRKINELIEIRKNWQKKLKQNESQYEQAFEPQKQAIDETVQTFGKVFWCAWLIDKKYDPGYQKDRGLPLGEKIKDELEHYKLLDGIGSNIFFRPEYTTAQLLRYAFAKRDKNGKKHIKLNKSQEKKKAEVKKNQEQLYKKAENFLIDTAPDPLKIRLYKYREQKRQNEPTEDDLLNLAIEFAFPSMRNTPSTRASTQ
ncbi:MAG: hypothetical protein P8176_02580 [Gammaproteobacteria bacterium]